MNTLTGELKNPLTAGKVIGPIKNPASYFNTDSKRGDPDFPMGRSTLMEFDRCPARWIHGYAGETSDAMDWGSLVDCLFLTPDQFKDRYVIAPESYPDAKTGELKPWNANSNWCKDWIAANSSKTVLKNKHFQPACDAVQILNNDPEVKALKDASQSQVMAIASYQDEETGIVVPLKILIDLQPAVESEYGKCLADLKTCTSAATRAWTRTVHDHNLHIQAALYLDVWTSCTGEDRTDFLHVVQENFAPFHVEKRMLSAEYIEIGRMRYMAALKRYCQCLKTGVWPGYEGSRLDWRGWGIIEPEPWMVQ